MTLYLKYRPQTLEELDLVEVRETLKKIVKSGSVPHAFLFSGPKGTGKTSAARILAKVVNCVSPRKNGEPCNKCDMCTSTSKGENLDVIEIDAASHRGIDDVRALRDSVKLAPARANKKVYIIDEAHMLTTEASNALLKTLEEPPAHVMFILATTNAEKLLETIRSRTVNIIFRKADRKEIVSSLKKKIKGEKVKADEESLELIAKAANGSFRDADKTLEQLISEGISLKEENVEEALFRKGGASVEALLGWLAKRDVKSALQEAEKAVSSGISMDDFVEQLLRALHESLLGKSGVGHDNLKIFSRDETIELIRLMSSAYSEMKFAVIEQVPIEIVIVRWCGEREDLKEKDIDGSPPKSVDKGNGSPSEKKKKEIGKDVAMGKDMLKEMGDSVWRRVLSEVKPKNTSVEALLRAARPLNFDGKTLTLGVFYRFHKERLEENHHRKILEDVMETILGGPVRVVCTLTEPPISKDVKKEKSVEESTTSSQDGEVVLTDSDDKDIVEIAKEIFGN